MCPGSVFDPVASIGVRLDYEAALRFDFIFGRDLLG
jgi:hypothetical protein